jgi:signal transduction histidine kinase
MSLPLRLAILFSTLLAIVLGVTGLATHAAIAGSERNAMESQLASEASQLIASTDLLQRNDVPFATPLEAPQDTITRISTFTEVCTPTGIKRRLQSAIQRGDALPLSEAGFDAVLQGRNWSEVVNVDTSVDGEGDSTQHLIFNQPVLQNDHVVAVAQIARPMETQEARLMTLRNWLVAGSGAATAAVFGLTWAVAAHGLHPLRRIVRTMSASAEHHEFSDQIEPSQFDGELQQLAASLNIMLQDLRHTHHLAEAQQAFVADVSHELRAPLTTVRGNLGLLQRNLSEEDRRAVLRDAVDEVERMSRLVNQLMMVARASAHIGARPGLPCEPSFCCEPIWLKPLVEEMTRKAAALAQDRRLFLAVASDVAATGNPDALRQVLLILLDNAAKFTPAGGQIVVSLETSAQHARISVSDTGVGIAPQDLPYVFDRGYRGSGQSYAASSIPSGNGLGLSIARQLMQAMGGALHVTSQLGTGSTFTVELPLVQSRGVQERGA